MLECWNALPRINQRAAAWRNKQNPAPKKEAQSAKKSNQRQPSLKIVRSFSPPQFSASNNKNNNHQPLSSDLQQLITSQQIKEMELNQEDQFDGGGGVNMDIDGQNKNHRMKTLQQIKHLHSNEIQQMKQAMEK